MSETQASYAAGVTGEPDANGWIDARITPPQLWQLYMFWCVDEAVYGEVVLDGKDRLNWRDMDECWWDMEAWPYYRERLPPPVGWKRPMDEQEPPR